MPAMIKWNNKLGTPRLIEFQPVSTGNKIASILTNNEKITIAEQFLVDNKSLLKISDPSSEFKIKSSSTDKEGFTHVRFQQEFKGIPVWAKDAYLHINSTGQVTSFNGEYVPTPLISDTTGSISPSTAITIVQQDLQSKGFGLSTPDFMKNKFGYSGPAAKKVIWYGNMPIPHLAWFVEARTGVSHDWYYFIDASDGNILKSYDNVDHDGPVSSSGTDLNGVTRSFSSYLIGGTYYMIDTAEPMYDAVDSKLPGDPVGGLETLNLGDSDLTAQSQFNFVTSTNNQWSDPSSISALYNASVAYGFYHNMFGRSSIDDSGMTIFSVVHVTQNGQPMDNAYWNGYFMCYGDGNKVFKPLAGGLDVAAHEMTHGITEHTANLEYVDQSGALNESMSDVFAVLVDSANWTIGEKVIKDYTDYPTGALRDLSNPHNGGVEGDPCWQPATLTEYVQMTADNGGVHTNSGIPNHAFYLVAQAIGRKEAGQIWYKALTSYLTRSSQFVDARIATISAATELYGGSSSEVTAVKNAWDGVGVVDSVGAAPPPTTMVVGPRYLLMTNTGSSDPNSIYMVKTAAVSNADFYPLSQTTISNKPAVSDNGQIILFVDGNHNLKALYTNPQNPQEQYIDSSGVWGSVSIGPGLSSIALTSVYADTTIYYYNLNSNVEKNFKITTPSYDGQNTKTAIYADAMSFDPTGNYLMFDAYNQILGAQGDTLHYWNIDLLDVSNGAISNVLPPQQQGIDVGNPSFSKTSPNRFAFDYWDENSGEHYVMAGDFSTGNLGIVAGPLAGLGYPTYSPDDDSVAYHTIAVYQSANHSVIDKMPLMNDKINGTGNPQQFAIDATFPVWFAIGNRVNTDIKNVGPKLPASFELDQNYPNPFNPTTTISYQISAPSHVTLKVYNVLGKEVETLVNGFKNAGKYHVQFDGARLASGVYLYRIIAGKYSETKKFLLIK